jgi:hypothetical protein
MGNEVVILAGFYEDDDGSGAASAAVGDAACLASAVSISTPVSVTLEKKKIH